MKTHFFRLLFCVFALFMITDAFAIDHPSATRPVISADRFTLVADGQPVPVIVSQADDKAVLHAAADLVEDFERVTGSRPVTAETLAADRAIIVGSLESPIIKGMIANGKFDKTELEGCVEK